MAALEESNIQINVSGGAEEKKEALYVKWAKQVFCSIASAKWVSILKVYIVMLFFLATGLMAMFVYTAVKDKEIVKMTAKRIAQGQKAENLRDFVVTPKIQRELLRPDNDSYHIIVSLLYYLLMLLNREYASRYALPVDLSKNNYAFRFKDMLEQHIYEKQRVIEYADLLQISRVTLNHAVKAQFGVSANHLLKQRLLAALKNEFLFSNRSITELADLFHFSDASHLMRFFKQQTGKTFTQYYQDYRAGNYE